MGISEDEKYSIGFDSSGHYLYKLMASIKLLANLRVISQKHKDAWGEKKSLAKIVRDMLCLIWNKRAWVEAHMDIHNYIEDYFVERLFKVSHSVNDYIIEGEGIRTMIAANLPFLKKVISLNSKQYFHKFCEKHNLPHVQCWGIIMPMDGKIVWRNTQGVILPFKELLKLQKVFAKTEYGTHGKGCFLIEYSEADNVFYINSKRCSEEELLQYITDEMLVETYVENHESLKSLHPSSLNTIRMLTLKKKEGIVLHASFLRIGTGGRKVDNFNSCGIGVCVSRDGSLSTVGVCKDYTKQEYLQHPDSQVLFSSVKIPYYKECVELVLAAHRKYSRVYGVGWDVAVTSKGPVLIEANPYFGFDLMQALDVPFRDVIENEFVECAKRNVKLTKSVHV